MSGEPAKSNIVEVVGDVLRVVKALGVVPPWLLWAAAVLAATVVVLADRMNLGALLKAWHEATKQAPDNSMPPIPMPEEGIPVPPKEWKDGEI